MQHKKMTIKKMRSKLKYKKKIYFFLNGEIEKKS